MESSSQFDRRKEDHIRIALDPRMQTGASGLDRIRLQHEAFPDLNFEDIQLQTDYWGHLAKVPLFISSMTAGHAAGIDLNVRLAKATQDRGWAMGVGSQRKELTDPEARAEWKKVRAAAPQALLFGNLGISQVITSKVSQVQDLIDGLQAQALFIHFNPLQECLQPEGTPHFKGGAEKLHKLCANLPVPVIAKEVGCGMTAETMKRLMDCGVAAIDVAGLGGTHWGRIEGQRSTEGSVKAQAAASFADWGLSTLESLLEARTAGMKIPLWGSGGVRSGLDAAKLLAVGSEKVGIAQPALQAALQGEAALAAWQERMEFELKTALFCTGCKTPAELAARRLWRWN